MSLFSAIGKVAGGVLKTVAPVAKLIPGVGNTIGGAATILGNVLSPTKTADVVAAVQRDGSVDVSKVENTIAAAAPAASPLEVSQMAVQATKELTSVVPTATINDSKSTANVDFMTKAIQWVKSNLLLVAGAVLAFVYFRGKKGGRRRW